MSIKSARCWYCGGGDHPEPYGVAGCLGPADVPGFTPDTCPEREDHGKTFRYCLVKGCRWHEGMDS